MPDELKTWLAKLAPVPLPVLDSTQAELNDLMSKDQLSVMLYAQPVMFDPGLAIQLLKTANQARKQGGRHALTTMSNVMSHFGQGALQQQLSRSQSLQQLKLPQRQQQGYLRYVSQSCHSSRQALDWSNQRGANEPEAVQLAGLLQNLAELSLWCYGDDVMPRIEQQAFVKQQPYEKAAQDILGCSIRSLSAELAKSWQLPELVIDALQVTDGGFTLAYGVALANRLARATARSWYATETLQCVEAIASYQGRAIAEVESRLHQNAIASTDAFVALGYVPPARLLPMLVDETYIDPQFKLETSDVKLGAEQSGTTIKDTKVVAPEPPAKSVKKSVPETRPAAKSSSPGSASPSPRATGVENRPRPESRSASKQVSKPAPIAEKGNSRADPTLTTTDTQRDKSPDNEFAISITTIQDMIKQGVKVQVLIQQVVDTIQLLGFERVMFALKVPKHNVLLAQFTAQQKGARPLKDIKIPLDNPNLFSRLLEKPQFVLMQESNRSKLLKLIPDKLAILLSNQRFFIGSVFNGNRPLGLMYADGFAKDVSEDQLKKFQALCRLLARGVTDILAAKQNTVAK